MKVKEFRIGNWIKYPDYFRNGNDIMFVIRDLFFDEDKVGLTDGKIQLLSDVKIINPIPLTEEWLLKFGFEKPAHSFNGDIFHLSEWDDFKNTWCVAMNKNNAVIFLKLKYVHQLQNLYFALTGTELIIIS